jgi:hypothetical protein
MWMTRPNSLTAVPPSASPNLPSAALPNIFSSYPSDAGTVTNGEYAHFKILTPAQPTPCLVQRRNAMFFESYRAHFEKHPNDPFCYADSI